MRRLLARAREWRERALALAAQRVPLKRLRELLHAGLRLGAALPQVDELRSEIRRREWEEAARKARRRPPAPRAAPRRARASLPCCSNSFGRRFTRGQAGGVGHGRCCGAWGRRAGGRISPPRA